MIKGAVDELTEAYADKNPLQSTHWLAQTWVRIASSVQSRKEAHWKTIAQVSETARWKRCVPRGLLIYARDSV